MKIIIYNMCLFLCGMLLFSSCTKEITADVKDLSGNPVINCFFRPDTNVSVQLTKSRPVLGNGTLNPYINIDNAIVNVYENGVAMPLSFDATAQRYVSSWVPHDGNSYSIKAVIPGVDKEISSTAQTVLAPMGLSTFSTDTNTVNGKLYMTAKFSIADQPGEDFYHVIIKFRCKTNGVIVFESPLYIDYNLTDPTGNSGTSSLANVNFREVNPYGGFVFSDKGMDGKQLTFALPSSVENLQCNENSDKELYVEVRKSSRAYYEYVLSVSEFIQNSGNPFGTPTQVYNNIENGRGVWATYSKTNFTSPL